MDLSQTGNPDGTILMDQGLDGEAEKQLEVEFEIKQAEGEPEGTFEGYASTFNNVDLDGDVIVQGAFAESLRRRGEPVRLLWQHDPRQPIGVIKEMAEDKKGLRFKAQLALGVQKGREAFELLKMKAVDRMSIGFMVPNREENVEFDRRRGVRKIKKVNLKEVSVVTFPANVRAKIDAVKRATRFANLPLGERGRRWNATAADRRVRAWAGATDAPNERYRRAFFWYDQEEPENFGSYKLQFADVVDGRLVAMPRGVFAAAAVLAGARGGVDIPAGDRAAVQRHVERYYGKMSDEFDEELTPPWNRSDGEFFEATLKSVSDLVSSVREMEKFLREAGFPKTVAVAVAAKFEAFVDDGPGEPGAEVLSESGADEVLKAIDKFRSTINE